MNSFTGEIRAFCYDFVPKGWILCDGRPLPINVSRHKALYSVIGTLYGGDSTCFRVPDLKGRVPVGAGAGPALTPRVVGDDVGTAVIVLDGTQLPTHSHSIKVIDAESNATDPDGAYWSVGYHAGGKGAATKSYGPAGSVALMAEELIQPTERPYKVQGHENRQPYLASCYCICLEGIDPKRS